MEFSQSLRAWLHGQFRPSRAELVRVGTRGNLNRLSSPPLHTPPHYDLYSFLPEPCPITAVISHRRSQQAIDYLNISELLASGSLVYPPVSLSRCALFRFELLSLRYSLI